MFVKKMRQQIPGCQPPGRDKGKNICYNPSANSAQENVKLGKECDIGCTGHHDCDVRIKESSIDSLDRTLSNVSHSLADWYELYEPRKEKEQKCSRLQYNK
jgi:hypothetical protein